MQHQGNDLGDGKNAEDEQWTIRSQALRGPSATQHGGLMGAVQRLDGGGSGSEHRSGGAAGSKI